MLLWTLWSHVFQQSFEYLDFHHMKDKMDRINYFPPLSYTTPNKNIIN